MTLTVVRDRKTHFPSDIQENINMNNFRRRLMNNIAAVTYNRCFSNFVSTARFQSVPLRFESLFQTPHNQTDTDTVRRN